MPPGFSQENPYNSKSGHMLGSMPSLQLSHFRQGMGTSATTRSPTDTVLISLPTATTSPDHSWPGTKGKVPSWLVPSHICTSVPQSPAALTRINASLDAGLGSGSSSSLRSPTPCNTAAFTGSTSLNGLFCLKPSPPDTSDPIGTGWYPWSPRSTGSHPGA